MVADLMFSVSGHPRVQILLPKVGRVLPRFKRKNRVPTMVQGIKNPTAVAPV